MSISILANEDYVKAAIGKEALSMDIPATPGHTKGKILQAGNSLFLAFSGERNAISLILPVFIMLAHDRWNMLVDLLIRPANRVALN